MERRVPGKILLLHQFGTLETLRVKLRQKQTFFPQSTSLPRVNSESKLNTQDSQAFRGGCQNVIQGFLTGYYMLDCHIGEFWGIRCSTLGGTLEFIFLYYIVLRLWKVFLCRRGSSERNREIWLQDLALVCAPEGTVSNGDTFDKAPFVQAHSERGGNQQKW